MRAALVALLAACGAAPPPVAPTPVAPTPAPVAKSTLPENIPDTPAGHQLAWLLTVLDAKHGEVSRDDVEAHFDKPFLDKVPTSDIIALASQVAPDFAEARVARVLVADGDALAVRVETKTAKFAVRIAVDDKGMLGGALLTRIFAESFDEVATMLPTIAPKAALLVAEVHGNTCKPLHAIHESDEMAIASTFKLYVLTALADQIMRGKLKWDQQIAIRDDWKSLPSGKTQNDAAGTKLSIRELADRMISISDNTATDHLLYTVGRKNVEAALHTAKHAQPLLDVPFPSTRELFILKLGTEDEMKKYLALKASPRRAFLDGALAKRQPKLEDAASWKTARHIEDLEWFASPLDLCGAMATLHERSAKVPEVLDVMAINPGIPLPKQTWKYVGFKGGSEPGVLAGNWLLERDDNKWFFVSLVANDATGPEPDEKRAFGLAGAILDLLATEDR